MRLRILQVSDAGEVAVNQHRVGERPEMLGGLEFGAMTFLRHHRSRAREKE
jgi:hypothetical protein